MYRKFAVTIAAAAAIGVAAAGCGSDDGSSTATSGGGGGDSSGGKEITYLSPVASQPNQQEIALGVERGAEEVGWSSSVIDANLSPDKQVAGVDTAITQKRAAIASWTLDPGATAGAYTRAVEAGIPVIGLNSEGEGVTATVWWETVTCEPGGPAERDVALFQKLKGDDAKVIVLGGPPVPALQAEVKCFTAAAQKAGLDIVDSADNTNDKSESAQRIAADLLTKHPDVEVFWAYNDATALGASAAVTGAGKTVATASGDQDGIVIVGHTGDADGIAAIKEKRQTATYDPNNMASGMATVKLMKQALDEGPDKTYPALTVKSDMITDENVGEWKPADQRTYTLDDLPLVK